MRISERVDRWYCRMFHSKIARKGKWYCEKCNLKFFKTMVDTGPK